MVVVVKTMVGAGRQGRRPPGGGRGSWMVLVMGVFT
jgi:hypothetical protein